MDPVQIMDNFSKYVGIVAQWNIRKALGTASSELEKERDEQRKVCIDIIKEHNLYSGEDIDSFIIKYTNRAYDKR